MRRRLGQHFLVDPNLLELIVRESGVGPEDVVLEVGGGEGSLSERLAPGVKHLHVIEIDERLRNELEPVAATHRNLSIVWGDAIRVDLRGLDPAPTRVVSNLPYSIATPLILRTIEELPQVGEWLVMVQLEIADRLRARPGTREYGAPSVLVQLACEVELVRKVDPAVFRPRPRVRSALVRLRRAGDAPAGPVRELVRAAFAHRRKSLPRSLELAGVTSHEEAAAALEDLELSPRARAESIAPEDFQRLAARIGGVKR